jgi:predicted Na+-dependent transporter
MDSIDAIMIKLCGTFIFPIIILVIGLIFYNKKTSFSIFQLTWIIYAIISIVMVINLFIYYHNFISINKWIVIILVIYIGIIWTPIIGFLLLVGLFCSKRFIDMQK